MRSLEPNDFDAKIAELLKIFSDFHQPEELKRRIEKIKKHKLINCSVFFSHLPLVQADEDLKELAYSCLRGGHRETADFIQRVISKDRTR